MKMIQDMVDNIDEELYDAEKYAECYIYERALGSENASTYRQMSQEEMSHAMFLHENAVKEIEKIKTVYDAPHDMLDKWNESHRHYVEWMARIRVMLQL